MANEKTGFGTVPAQTSAHSLSESPDASPSSVGNHASLPEIFTVDELTALLRLNRKTTYEAIAAGKIPGAVRIGRTIRISRAAVLDWFRNGQGRVSRSRR
jgi:excisionase family DNA binding protein